MRYESDHGTLWDWIWKLKIPPKIRNFVWRVCHEIIPTRVALMRRQVGTGYGMYGTTGTDGFMARSWGKCRR